MTCFFFILASTNALITKLEEIAETGSECQAAVENIEALAQDIISIMGLTSIANEAVTKFHHILKRISKAATALQFTPVIGLAVRALKFPLGGYISSVAVAVRTTRTLESSTKPIREAFENLTRGLGGFRKVLALIVEVSQASYSWVVKGRDCVASLTKESLKAAGESVLESICSTALTPAGRIYDVLESCKEAKNAASQFMDALRKLEFIGTLEAFIEGIRTAIGLFQDIDDILSPIDATIEKVTCKIQPLLKIVTECVALAGKVVRKLPYVNKAIDYLSRIQLPGLPSLQLPIPFDLSVPPAITRMLQQLHFAVPRLPGVTCPTPGPCRSKHVCYLTFQGTTLTQCAEGDKSH